MTRAEFDIVYALIAAAWARDERKLMRELLRLVAEHDPP